MSTERTATLELTETERLELLAVITRTLGDRAMFPNERELLQKLKIKLDVLAWGTRPT